MGLDDKEKRLINLHIRDTRGALYYAHCWILVEGSTEKIILSRCADVMGHDLNINGIQIVPFSNSNITVNTKLADYLGIPWILVADGDTGGTGYTAMGNNYVNKMRTDVCNPPYYSIIQLVEQDIETLLCMSGFGSVYYDVIHEKYPIYRNKYPDKTWDDITKGCSDDTKLREKVTEMLTINKNSKPMLVEKVVEKIVEKGKDGVPSQLQSIIITAIRFARGDAS
jgi:predicted ATP-dependent endonuclease of OLD family